MLFFISGSEEDPGGSTEFKYISCYSLSEQCRIQKYLNLNLNTSHVILYQGTGALYVKISEFKYISCYSLS